jgi:hypothetical protein
MIEITLSGDAPEPLQAAVAKLIQDTLESRRYVCVLDSRLQRAVELLDDEDYRQARGQDIFVSKGEED